MIKALQISDAVSDALTAAQPVVALESTIITHGMPWPDNYDTAVAVEEVVRAAGATPATIAVINGTLKVGLDNSDIERLAHMSETGEPIMKLSRADLALALSQGVSGSTTVAATMIVAHLAGITFFATGGIGGVHRGFEKTMDVSADLTELARTPVNVVCAGAKAILDIPRTLEYLETMGVPVVTLGQQNIPAFWSRDGGIKSPIQLPGVKETATFINTRHTLKLGGATLVMNPIPAANEIPPDRIEQWITTAIQNANEQGISGKAVTPFLLSRINLLSQGESLKSNIALIKHNADIAAKLASAASLLGG